MRKHQQRRLLELLKTLALAQSEGLWADCQAGAIAAGSFIEDMVGEDTETVRLLEEYCELLFWVSRGEADEKTLGERFLAIEESARRELKPDRVEMVFLPYKSSMADSLESIYLTAKSDENCDAFWIPIPYFELNGNISSENMQIEGQEYYGEKISCTDWREYNIEARHPDIIFIHYPYDDRVKNASVHPLFYSERLCEQCELLVYVPYFVAPYGVVEDYCAALPGVLHSHRVIVESEAVRSSYIEHYKRFDEQFGWKGKYGTAEEKFIALGSPKFDKILGVKREDCPMPDGWRMIYKPDGSRKKVILYNTHMFEWLNGGEMYFKKVRSVFEAFRGREDVVLWWRPHPNTELNFKTQRPKYIEEYRRIVEEYRQGGWGIFDDTPDWHRAMVWSDAYYGDASSLTALYGLTGNPVVLQDIKETGPRPPKFCVGDFALDENGVCWGFDLFYDALFKMDFRENRLELVASSGEIPVFYGHSMYFGFRYMKVVPVGDAVICLPYFLKTILVYDQKKKSARTVDLKYEGIDLPENTLLRLRYAAVFQGIVYCFGYLKEAVAAVVAFDPRDDSVGYHTELYDRFGSLQTDGKSVRYPIFFGECDGDGNVLLILRGCPYLLQYHLVDREVNIVAASDAVADCGQACFDGEFFWLVTAGNDELLRWNVGSSEIKRYSIPSPAEDVLSTDGFFLYLAEYDRRILLFPNIGSEVLAFDKEGESFSLFEDLPPGSANDWNQYYRPKWSGDSTFAFSRTDAAVYELPRHSKGIKAYPFTLPPENIPGFTRDVLDAVYRFSCGADTAGELFLESSLGVLEGFMDILFSLAPKYKEEMLQKRRGQLIAGGRAGEHIYHYTKSLVSGSADAVVK